MVVPLHTMILEPLRPPLLHFRIATPLAWMGPFTEPSPHCGNPFPTVESSLTWMRFPTVMPWTASSDQASPMSASTV